MDKRDRLIEAARRLCSLVAFKDDKTFLAMILFATGTDDQSVLDAVLDIAEGWVRTAEALEYATGYASGHTQESSSSIEIEAYESVDSDA